MYLITLIGSDVPRNVDRIDKSGSQGQGRQSLGQNITEFNFFARVPRQ